MIANPDSTLMAIYTGGYRRIIAFDHSGAAMVENGQGQLVRVHDLEGFIRTGHHYPGENGEPSTTIVQAANGNWSVFKPAKRD